MGTCRFARVCSWPGSSWRNSFFQASRKDVPLLSASLLHCSTWEGEKKKIVDWPSRDGPIRLPSLPSSRKVPISYSESPREGIQWVHALGEPRKPLTQDGRGGGFSLVSCEQRGSYRPPGPGDLKTQWCVCPLWNPETLRSSKRLPSEATRPSLAASPGQTPLWGSPSEPAGREMDAERVRDRAGESGRARGSHRGWRKGSFGPPRGAGRSRGGREEEKRWCSLGSPSRSRFPREERRGRGRGRRERRELRPGQRGAEDSVEKLDWPRGAERAGPGMEGARGGDSGLARTLQRCSQTPKEGNPLLLSHLRHAPWPRGAPAPTWTLPRRCPCWNPALKERKGANPLQLRMAACS